MKPPVETMYFSFIRPVLEYSDLERNNCSCTLSDNIENVQIQIASVVSGNILRTQYTLMQEKHISILMLISYFVCHENRFKHVALQSTV